MPFVVEPEFEDNYELGFKSVLLDHHLVLNADAFWDEDTNYQATIVQIDPIVVNYIANIPSVRSRGVEADLHAEIVDGLSSYLSAAYTDATYVDYPFAPCPIENYLVNPGPPAKLVVPASCNLSNQALPATSKWAFSFGGEYDRPLGDFGLGRRGVAISVLMSAIARATSVRPTIPSTDACRASTIANLRIGVRSDDKAGGIWKCGHATLSTRTTTRPSARLRSTRAL